MTQRPLRPLGVVAGLFAVIVAVQLLSFWLSSRRPAETPGFLASAAVLVSPDAPTLGAARGDIVIYLFSDYACGNCRVLHPDLRRLVAEDAGVRLVYRDWPILGERSVRAAQLALASVAQGGHAGFDDALMRGGTLDEASLRAAAAAAGLDWDRLDRDARAPRITALLADTDRQARALRFAGTPAMVVGPWLVNSRVPLDRLRELVKRARAAR